MKKNIVIVLLVIVVLGMGGFIIYDKVLKKDEVKEKQTETKKLITDVKKFPEENDDTVKWSGYLSGLLYIGQGEEPITDLNQNFKDLEFKTFNDIKYTISCVYGEENIELEIPKCNSVDFKFADFNTKSTYDIGSTCGLDSNIIITDEYIIEQKSGCGAGGPITVKDKNGDIVLGVENSVIYYSTNVDNDNYYGIKVVDNVLYYLSYDGSDLDVSDQYDIEFNSFDLINLKKKNIQTFKGMPGGLE